MIASFGRNSQITAITFELAIFFLGVGAVIGGRWQDRVGPRNVIMTGVALWNYGWILTAWGVAGVVGPFIAARVKDFSGSYHGAFTPIAIMLTIAAILPLITRKPQPAATPVAAT